MSSPDQPLENQRHELFAQAIASGMTKDAAHAEAGYKRDRSHAARLASNGCIRARVRYLKGLAAERVVITLEGMIERAEEARKAGLRLQQIGPAVAAIKELGILTGLRVEKRENAHKSLHELSNDELRDIAARGRADVAGSPSGSGKLH
jgi:phage terminase small subunit